MHTLFYTGWQGKPSLVSPEKKYGGCLEMCGKNSARRGNTEAKPWSGRTVNRRGWGLEEPSTRAPGQGEAGAPGPTGLSVRSLGFFHLWWGDH